MISRIRNPLSNFLSGLTYVSLGRDSVHGWQQIKRIIRDDAVTVFYLSVGPKAFQGIIENLKGHGLARPGSRIVVEKPFGHDRDSAAILNRDLSSAFAESQIYRIDHYLGKETVQNLMALRFGNVLFEPLWNSQYVDHIQITVAESIGVKGRGGYYESSGAIRDMIQNHLMQLLCLTAMEPPSKFEPNAVRDEKLKVIRSLVPLGPDDIVMGQYGGGNGFESYLADVGVECSRTESYAALKCGIANWRWAGVPFYIRTGKRLENRISEIAVVFRKPPHSIFGNRMVNSGNTLVIRLQPNEGITMRVTIKEPGPGGMRLVEVRWI